MQAYEVAELGRPTSEKASKYLKFVVNPAYKKITKMRF
jgi:hypothetical protein